ncbi:MAG TPA: hypothetical protein VGG26_07385 [Terracidiphilus sp.]|jgi:hypothetical protein
MRKLTQVIGLAGLFLSLLPSSFAKTPPKPKDAPGTIVITFKDGHKQSFNLADIARVEFSGAPDGASTAAELPPRGQFIGRWLVGDGNGDTFIIKLDEDGDATRSLHEVHGTWVYVNGEARITWDDGWQDAIRKVGSKFQKYAYTAGKSFTDRPDNVTAAENTAPRPI